MPDEQPWRGDQRPTARALGRLLSRTHGQLRSPTSSTPSPEPLLHVPSRPETVVWGHIPTGRAPVATIDSGTTVRIDTVSQQGMTTDAHPMAFFEALGIPAADVLGDVVDIYESVPRPETSGHVLTGPLHVAGARSGDTLEIHLLAAELRVPYGVNRGKPGSGVLPDILHGESLRLLRTDGERFAFAPGICVPQAPFPGILAVAPPEGSGFVTSRPPDRWGGNLDLKELTAGSRLFLPVHARGAQFFVGDPHSAQGDGEVNGTAIEHSTSYTCMFVLHPGLGLDVPVAESPAHYIAMGIDVDLDVALEAALTQAIELLVGLTATGAFVGTRLDVADAYALCSIAVDFAVAEGVNHTKVVHAKIPKSIFTGGGPA